MAYDGFISYSHAADGRLATGEAALIASFGMAAGSMAARSADVRRA